jgi:hypothetical protein
MGEIKQFAQTVIPKPRFIFDRYKVSVEEPLQEEQPQSQ